MAVLALCQSRSIRAWSVFCQALAALRLQTSEISQIAQDNMAQESTSLRDGEDDAQAIIELFVRIAVLLELVSYPCRRSIRLVRLRRCIVAEQLSGLGQNVSVAEQSPASPQAVFFQDIRGPKPRQRHPRTLASLAVTDTPDIVHSTEHA